MFSRRIGAHLAQSRVGRVRKFDADPGAVRSRLRGKQNKHGQVRRARERYVLKMSSDSSWRCYIPTFSGWFSARELFHRQRQASFSLQQKPSTTEFIDHGSIWSRKLLSKLDRQWCTYTAVMNGLMYRLLCSTLKAERSGVIQEWGTRHQNNLILIQCNTQPLQLYTVTRES